MKKNIVMRSLLPMVLTIGLLFGAPGYSASTLDLEELAIGGRAIALGKAYTAIAEDTDALYSNVGGIGLAQGAKLSYTYTSVLGDVGYTQFGGFFPTEWGTFGLSYYGTMVDGSYNSYLVDGQIVAGSTNYSYSINTIMGSYGYHLAENLSLGVNIKMIGEEISSSNAKVTASGLITDLGLLYKVNENLQSGVSLQNLLGTAINWSNGTVESIPYSLKCGVAWTFLGNNTWLKLEDQKALISVETEMDAEEGLLIRSGIEYWPMDSIALRGGLGQEAEADSATSYSKPFQLSAGVGLRFSGFAFDYGFQQNAYYSSGDTHLFTMSYVGGEGSLWGNHIIPSLGLQDKTITYIPNQRVAGFVSEKVVKLFINGEETAITAGQFRKKIGLETGRNVIRLIAKNDKDEIIDAAWIRVLVKAQFPDIAEKHWAKDKIEDIATLGDVKGYPDGTFKPANMMSRQEVTTLLTRAKGYDLKEDAPSLFRDVSYQHWAKSFINSAYTNALVLGYPDGTFRPKNNITRAEGITMFVRFQGENSEDNVFEKPFWDVPTNHWAAKYVAMGTEDKMIDGYPDGSFKLNRNISRAEAVKILANSEYGQTEIMRLYDWESYFIKDDLDMMQLKSNALGAST